MRLWSVWETPPMTRRMPSWRPWSRQPRRRTATHTRTSLQALDEIWLPRLWENGETEASGGWEKLEKALQNLAVKPHEHLGRLDCDKGGGLLP